MKGDFTTGPGGSLAMLPAWRRVYNDDAVEYFFAFGLILQWAREEPFVPGF